MIMGKTGGPTSSVALRRWGFRLFGVPLLGALIAAVAIVIMGDWRLGERSPGVMAIARSALRFYIPLIGVFFWVLPSIRNALLIRRLRRLSSPLGLRWDEFL